MTRPDPSSLGDFYVAFLSILLEGAPYILLGTLISGFIHAYLPSNALERLLPKNGTVAVLVSGLLGGILPVCECATVPVIRRLVRKGLPVSCAVTYMLASPIINPVVVISTWSAFSGGDPWSMVGARLAMGYMVAVIIGLFVHRLRPSAVLKPSVLASGGSDGSHDHSELPGATKLVLALRTTMRDFLDTSLYFTIGVLITAVFNSQVPADLMVNVAGNDLIAVPFMMAMAFVLSLCSTTDAFIAAQIGVLSNVSKLAFLVYGPMMDVKLVFLYSTVFKKKFVFWMAVAIGVLIALLCIPAAMVL